MDNFREWLSDNLRYFMVGGAALLIVVVLFFGIRACVGDRKGDSGQGDQVTAENNQGEDPSSQTKDEETDDEKKDANPMETGNEEITTLVKAYYKALGEKDVTALNSLAANLSPAEQTKVVNAKDYIEGYEVKEVYTKKGLTDGTYVAYAVYDYLCKDITTPVPAMSEMYVFTDAGGSLKIDGAAIDDADVSAYMEKLKQDTDVAELYADVKQKNDAAQAGDAALKEFLDGLGTDAGASTNVQDGEMLTATDDCNVRAAADGDAEIIGGIATGTQVEKKGAEGEWIKIEYEGQTGYVHSGLLE